MTCEQVDMLLAEWVFGELDAESEQGHELAAHFTACESCRERLADMRVTAQLLREGMTAGAAPRLSEPMRSALLRQVSPRPLLFRIPRPLALAASVAIVVLIGLAVLNRDQADRGPVAYRMESQDESIASSEAMEMKEEGLDLLAQVPAPMAASERAADRADDAESAFQQPARVGNWSEASSRGRRGVAGFAGGAAAPEPPAAVARSEPAPRSNEPELLARSTRLEAKAATPDAVPAEAAKPVAREANILPSADRPKAAAAELSDAVIPPPPGAVAVNPAIKKLAITSILPAASQFPMPVLNRAIPTQQQSAIAIAPDPDTSSVQLTQQYFSNGFLPPPGAVRTEAFYNAMQTQPAARIALQNAQPQQELSLSAAAASAPLGLPGHLMSITITAPIAGDAANLAVEDLKLLVEFDPQRVEKVRLLGYEDRMLDEAAVSETDAELPSDLRSGQQVSALYLVTIRLSPSNTIANAAVRYTDPATGEKREQSLEATPAFGRTTTIATDPELFLSFAAALFAEKLRGSDLAVNLSLDQLVGLVDEIGRHLPSDDRVRQLREMILQARDLPPAP